MLSEAFLQQLGRYLQAHLAEKTVLKQAAPLKDSGTLLDYEPSGLDDFINQKKKPSFVKTLFHFIDDSGGQDSEIYKRAGLDRRHFSKIRSNLNYRPRKVTAIALALALELDREKTDMLLAAAGYALSESETFDLIIAYCIDKKIYKLTEVNQALDYFNQKTIGTTA